MKLGLCAKKARFDNYTFTVAVASMRLQGVSCIENAGWSQLQVPLRWVCGDSAIVIFILFGSRSSMR